METSDATTADGQRDKAVDAKRAEPIDAEAETENTQVRYVCVVLCVK